MSDTTQTETTEAPKSGKKKYVVVGLVLVAVVVATYLGCPVPVEELWSRTLELIQAKLGL